MMFRAALIVFSIILFSHQSLADEVAAELLVRRQYFEEMPFGEGRKLAPAGIRRLVVMLRDPSEISSHANIVTALGQSESPLAFRALRRWEQRVVSGEISADEYRARMALPMAYGHLGRSDTQALEWLIQEVRRGPEPTSWSYRHLNGIRLGEILYQLQITALATTGSGEAETELTTLEKEGRLPARSRSIDSARNLHRRIRQFGAESVFRSQEDGE